jgi:hypothetical protein
LDAVDQIPDNFSLVSWSHLQVGCVFSLPENHEKEISKELSEGKRNLGRWNLVSTFLFTATNESESYHKPAKSADQQF